MAGGKIYFASDLHLGYPNRAESLERERLFVRWLDMVAEDAAELWLVGDVLEDGPQISHGLAFCLFGLALGGPRLLGPVTPLGGLAFIAGWLALVVHALPRYLPRPT